MSKERLEEIKDGIIKCEKYAEIGDWEASYSYIINLHDDGHIKWLIEQAEREVSHSNKINKLHFFLDSNVADLASERCGYHVIDVAIHVMKKQTERAQELEEDIDRLNGALHYQLTQENIRNEENRKLRKQNKRYREEIEFAREELFLALCESKSELEKRHHVKSARHFLLKALEGEEK